jgi:CheY-like chemotaxis protein
MGKRILVVDDEPDVVTFLCTLLEEHGFRTSCAQDGAEGMRKARSEPPDLLCLDILMPGKSGVFMYEELKLDDRLRDIPVFIVTGFKSSDRAMAGFVELLKERSLSAPEGYFEKPIDSRVFLRAVDRILQGKGPPSASGHSEKRRTHEGEEDHGHR